MLSEILGRDGEEMRNLLGRFAGPIFTVLWMLGISFVWAFLISWRLSLVATGCLPVVWGATTLLSNISSKWEERSNVAAAQAGDIFTETFTKIRVVPSTLDPTSRASTNKLPRSLQDRDILWSIHWSCLRLWGGIILLRHSHHLLLWHRDRHQGYASRVRSSRNR